jgi:gluconolactonase
MRVLIASLWFALTVAAAAAADDAKLADAQYPEGALWHGQRLYYAEMERDVVMASDLKASAPFWEMAGCGPVSIAPYREDEFLVLCHLAHQVVRVSREGTTLEVIDRDAKGRPFVYPNASSADVNGGVYFSSSGTFSLAAPAAGSVLYLDAKGRLTRVAQGIRYANGVAVDGPRRRLLVSAHLARKLLAFPIEAPGKLGRRRVFFNFAAAGVARGDYPLAGPDGLEVAPNGDVVVAEYGAGRIHKISAGGEWLGAQDGFAPFVTDMALLPGDLAAVTASRVNDAPPFPGSVVVREKFLQSFVK